MAVRERSISLPIVLASVAVILSIALLVGWTLVFSRYIEVTSEPSGNVPVLILGIISFVIIMAVMVVIVVFLVREILESRKHYRFMDSVTHELKSPLAAMRLSAQTLGNPKVTSEQRERLRQMILSDVDRLTIVIDDILVAGRLDGLPGAIEWVEVNLHDLIEESLTVVCRRYDVSEDTIRNEVPQDVWLLTDRSALGVAVSNLVDNGLKYSDVPRSFTVRLVDRPKGAKELRFIDQGIGIRLAEQRRVRRRFYRVADEAVRRRHGTGLGLYIVNGLVSRVGASFQIRSRGEGQGTTMVIRLPKKYLRVRESEDCSTRDVAMSTRGEALVEKE